MNYKFLLFCVLFCGLGMESCGTTRPKKYKPSKSEVHLTQADSGKSIYVKAGEDFEITLNECVGCAEVWQIGEIDTTRIAFLANTYSGRSCQNCDGGSQDNSFHFRVLRPGASKISLHYFSQKVELTIDGYIELH